MRKPSATSVRYEFDGLNRLVITNPFDTLQPRRVVEGRVSTDANNRLTYEVDTVADRGERPRAQTVILDGTWRLTAHHDLALSLHETARQTRQTLYLKGAVIKAEANALVFALRRRETEDLSTAQRITLFGRWAADAKNRLNFLVEKADGSEDSLTLQSGWEIGKHHELFYRYREQTGRGGRGPEHAIVFDGAWDITGSDRLVYRLSGSADSTFEFRASLQSPSLQAREGRLIYQVGIGFSGGRAETTRVVLSGTWKLNEDKSVSFEIPYVDGRREAIRFSARYTFAKQNEIAIDLFDRRGEPLGISVTFSRQFLDDAQWFVRLSKEGKDAEVLAGVQIRF